MKVLLISVGSRGDAEPFCALAQQLLANQHKVDIFLQSEHQALVPKGANFHALPFQSQDFYKYAGAPKYGADHPNPRVKFVGIVADIIASLVLPTATDVSKVAAAADDDDDDETNAVDVLISSSLARPLAIAVAEKHALPLVIVHLQPLAPTSLFPHSSHTEECIKAIMNTQDSENRLSSSETLTTSADEGAENLQSYWELEQFQYDFLKESLDKTYQELDMGDKLQTFEDLQTILSGKHGRIHIANCFSLAIVPEDKNRNKNVHQIGPLADDFVPSEFEPPEDLVQFLSNCKTPPICVGYGSMPFDKVTHIIQALEELNETAVLVGNALQIPVADDSGNSNNSDKEYVRDNIFQIANIPYPWLLPQCRMMLSHGGAGVLNATLRAGIPPIISPLMGDQFFWAALVSKLGIGVRTESMLPALTKDDIKKAVQDGKGCITKAKAMGDEIRTCCPDGGVSEMVKLLESVTVGRK